MNTGVECESATKLLNAELTMAQRAHLAEDYFKKRMASIPVTDRRHVNAFRAVVAKLVRSVPADQRLALERVLRKAAIHTEEERKQQSRQLAAQLRSIAPGTAILVRDRSGEKPVVFCEMKRTRFVFKCPNGRRCIAPLQCFVRVEPGHPVPSVADSPNPQSLQQPPGIGAGEDAAKPKTPPPEPWMVRGTLDYFADFPRNQNKDSEQFLNDPVLDYDLKELIRELIRAVAAADDIDWFRKQVLQYPDASVRDLVLRMLDAGRSDRAFR